jgi:hypothetical protein
MFGFLSTEDSSAPGTAVLYIARIYHHKKAWLQSMIIVCDPHYYFSDLVTEAERTLYKIWLGDVIPFHYTVKRVDEVVRHPHLVTQDQNTQVSKKVSDIPEENFTINIKLYRQTFTNVELLR